MEIIMPKGRKFKAFVKNVLPLGVRCKNANVKPMLV